MMMPEMTGPEVAHALRTDPITSTIPNIFLTGMLDKASAASLVGAIPGEVYLAKPATTEEIVEAVEVALGFGEEHDVVAEAG